MLLLKQSTAKTIKMGPFLDDTDGKTAETGLTIAQADIRLTKNGGDFAQTNNSAGATHDENGYYDVPLDTTDTGTLGTLRVAIAKSGALPVWQDFMVVTANIYDSLCSTDIFDVSVTQIGGATVSTTSAQLGVNVVQISEDATAADNCEAMFDGTGYAGGTAKLSVDVNKWNGTAVATPDTAGYPKVTIKSGTGSGEINLSSGNLAGSVASVTGAVGSVTGAVGSVTGNVGGNVVGSVASVTGAVGSVSGNVGGNVTGSVGFLAAQAKTDVNEQVVDALGTDTLTELSQAAPPATPTIKQALMLLYMALRNETNTTSALLSIKNDAGTVICKAALSDNGTTFTKAELVSGP